MKCTCAGAEPTNAEFTSTTLALQLAEGWGRFLS
jgi:hypothetical protein